ncbi:hypothetical protein F2Q70_00018315 [Brassica cretica]|uniref:DUF1985 domain-containing protein n=1 Tax=Brassica cretica TaxID=69181 RepID=A0A8S9KUD2_BRACR|nr:hypothetical protein F2Q70_00018315 [Brassica cretica]KAF2598155.1 hypothetical protein F2Q68_00011579 [Brassica cretica]
MATVNLKRIFAAGEEPSGERNSTFAKVIALEENPPFSGAFGHFILVRRLKTNKKYEIWILFAGYPIRSSLKEFAIVTWLDCGKIPVSKRMKRKNPLNEKLYWKELFGSLKSCSIEMVVDMLKNRKSFISASHIDIAEKDEIALAQDSFALRGYVDAIQLVMIAAIPALKEEVVLNEPVLLEESESDTEMSAGDDTQTPVDVGEGDKPAVPARFVINPKNARDLNVECKVPVRSILDDPHEEWLQDKDFSWPDENSDTTVDTLVRLIGECFIFKNELFTGGLTVADIDQPKQIKNQIGGLEARILKAMEVDAAQTSSGSVLASKITALESSVSSLQGVEDRINLTVSGSLKVIEESVLKAVSETYSKMLTKPFAVHSGGQNNADNQTIIAELDKKAADTEAIRIDTGGRGLADEANPPSLTSDNGDDDESESEELDVSDNLVQCPSFSFGLTQDGNSNNVVDANPIEYVLPEEKEAPIPAEIRKSKRPKSRPAAYTDFQCDPKLAVQYFILPDLETLFADVQQRVLTME